MYLIDDVGSQIGSNNYSEQLFNPKSKDCLVKYSYIQFLKEQVK